MAKYVLNTNSEELDFVLIGITSSENLYSIVNSVNYALGIELVLSDNVPYNLKAGKTFNFSLFRFLSEEFGIEFFLIPNNSNLEETKDNKTGGDDLFSDTNVDESTRLVKELPKTDYFIILKGEDLHMYQFKIADKLKTIKDIIQIQTIEPRDLPSRMNLVF